MSKKSVPAPLFLPGGVLFLMLFVLPMAGLFIESIRYYEPGSIGSASDAPFTLANYRELLKASFAGFFWQTLRISFLASAVGISLAFPLAYWIARRLSPQWRMVAIGFFVTLMFLSVLVRTYALELTFGAAGPLGPFLRQLGVATNGRGYIGLLVGAGLLHYIIPMSTLTLLGTIQNVDPRLTEAAQVLGAPNWKAHLDSDAAALHARHSGCVSVRIHLLDQCFRDPDDPWQGPRPVHLKLDLHAVQRNRQLSKRCGNIGRIVLSGDAHRLRNDLSR